MMRFEGLIKGDERALRFVPIVNATSDSGRKWPKVEARSGIGSHAHIYQYSAPAVGFRLLLRIPSISLPKYIETSEPLTHPFIALYTLNTPSWGVWV